MFWSKEDSEEKEKKKPTRTKENPKKEDIQDQRARRDKDPKRETSVKDTSERDGDKKDVAKRNESGNRNEGKRIEPRDEKAKRDTDVKDVPKRDTNVKDVPKRDTNVKDVPKRDTNVKDVPKRDTNVKDVPKRDTEVKDVPKRDAEVKDVPKRDAEVREEPSKTEAPKKEPRKTDPSSPRPRDNSVQEKDRSEKTTQKDSSKAEDTSRTGYDSPHEINKQEETAGKGETKSSSDTATRNEKATDDQRSTLYEEPAEDIEKDTNPATDQESNPRSAMGDNENDEYGFIPDKEEHKNDSKTVITTIIRIISCAPVFVTFLSLSHFIRGIPYQTMAIGVCLMALNFIISYFVTTKILEDNYTPTLSYSSLAYSVLPPLSILIDVFIVFLKFVTCVFFMDLFLESFYVIYPEYRIPNLEFGMTKGLCLVGIFIFVVLIIFLYNLNTVLQFGFELVSIISACVILFGIFAYSKMDTENLLKSTVSSKSPVSDDFMLQTFVVFSFLSFGMECQSATAYAVRKSKSSAMLVGVLSILVVACFTLMLIYFGSWMAQFKLKDVLGDILPSTSNINMTLKSEGGRNLLPYTMSVSVIVLGLSGFIINLAVLGNSMFSLISVSEIVATVLICVVSFAIVTMVIYEDLGKLLWYIMRVIFFIFPFYALYPYLSFMLYSEKGKFVFILSIIACLALCFFVYLSFASVLSINHDIFKY